MLLNHSLFQVEWSASMGTLPLLPTTQVRCEHQYWTTNSILGVDVNMGEWSGSGVAINIGGWGGIRCEH